MTQIESVSFSDPELIEIQQVLNIDRAEGDPDADYDAELAVEDDDEEDDEALLASLRPDWLLISLAPFDTDETLTLTLTDGRTVDIAVTDARVAGQATSNRNRVTVDGVTYTLTAGGILVNNNNRIPNSTSSGQYPNMANYGDGTTYYGKATVYALSAGCTIHDEITYGGNLYKVWNIATSSNNLTNIGAKMDREFVNRAAGYKFSLPKVKTDISDEEKAQLRTDGFVFGKNNEEIAATESTPKTPAADNKLWKKATYDPASNSITYEIKTFQAMKEDVPLDFIFIYDDSITMYTGDRGAPTNNGGNNYNETVIRETQGTRIMILSAAQALMGATAADGYDIRMALGGASDGDNRRSSWLVMGDAGYAGVEDYLSTYATGVTNHDIGVGNALALARESVGAGRQPIVIYLSDFKDGRHTQATIDQLHSLARVYTLQTANRTTPYPRARQITTDPNTTFFNMSEIDEGVQNLENIILDAIGYYMNDPVVITDNLSEAMQGYTPGTASLDSYSYYSEGSQHSGTAGAANQQAGKSVWTIGGTNPAPGAGQVYTETFTVELDDETIYAGAMPTNGKTSLTRGGGETNYIEPDADDPDHLHLGGNVNFVLGRLDEKDNMLKDDKGVPTNLVSGIQFTLVREEDDEIIDTYTTVNGGFEIPYKKTITDGASQSEIVVLELGKTYSLQEIDSSVEAYNADKDASDLNNPKLKKPDKHWIISVAANGVVTVKPEEAASQTPKATIAKATPGDSQANPPTTGTPPRIVLWNKIVVPAILIPLEIQKTWVGGSKRDPVPFTIYGIERSTDTNPGEKHPLVAYDGFNAETANVVAFIGPGNKGFKESGDVWTQKVYVLNEADNHTFYDYENSVDLNSMTSGQILTIGDLTLNKEQWAQLDEDGDGKVPYGQTYSYAIEEGDLVYEEGWYTPTYNNNATSTTLNVRQGNIPAQSADENKSWLNYVSDYGGSTTDSLYFELDIYNYTYGESDKADFNTTLGLAKNDYTLNSNGEKQKCFERLRSLEIVVQDTGEDDTYYRITVPVSGNYNTSGDSNYSLGAAVFGKIRTPESWKNYAGNLRYGNIPKTSLEVREVYAKFKDGKGYVIYSSGPGVDSATGVNITRRSSVNNSGSWGLHLNTGYPVGDHWHTTAMYRFLNYDHYDEATVTPSAQTLEIYARRPSAPAQTVPATDYTLNSCTLEIRNSWNPNVLIPVEVTKKWENASASDKQSINFCLEGTTTRGGRKSLPIFAALDNEWSAAQSTGVIEKTTENENNNTWKQTFFVPTFDVLGTYDRTKDPVCEAYSYTRTDLTDAEKNQIANDISEGALTVLADEDGYPQGEWETGTPQYADGETVYSQTEFEWKENSSILTGNTVYLKLHYQGIPTDPSKIKAIRVAYKEQIGTYTAKRIIILNLDGGLTQGNGDYYIPFRFSDDIQKANGSNQLFVKWGCLTEEVHTIEGARKKGYTEANNWSLVAAPEGGALTATLKDAFFAWEVPKVESMTLPSFTLTNTFTPNMALTLNSVFNDASLDKDSTKDIESVTYIITGTTAKGDAYSRTVTTTATPADASTDSEVERTFSKMVYIPKGTYTVTQTAYTVDGQQCAPVAYTVTNTADGNTVDGTSRGNYALEQDAAILFNNTRKQLPVKVKMDWEPGLAGSEDPLAASIQAGNPALQYTISFEDSHHALHPLTGDSYELTTARQVNNYNAIPTYSIFGTYTVCELGVKDPQSGTVEQKALPEYNLSVVPEENVTEINGTDTNALVFTIEAHIKRAGIVIEKHFDEAFSFNEYKGATLTYTIKRSDGHNIYGTGTDAVEMTIKVPTDVQPEMLTGEFALSSQAVISYYAGLDAKTKEAYPQSYTDEEGNTLYTTIDLPILRTTDLDGGNRVKYILTETVSGVAKTAYFPSFTDQSGNPDDAFEQTNPPGQNEDSPTFGDANKAKFILNPGGIVVGIDNANTPYICKIVETFTDENGNTGVAEMPFRYLNAAVKYARENITMDSSHPVRIQMLVDYVIPGSNADPGTTPARWAANDRVVLGTGTATAPDGSTVSYTDNFILSTAATSGGLYNFADTAENKADADKGKAILERGYNGTSLFTVGSGAGLGFTNIILDGDKSAHQGTANGGLVNVNAGTLNITTGATLRNSSTTADGGAVYADSGSNVVMTGGAISDCLASSSGGAIYCEGSLTVNGTDTAKVAFTGNRANGDYPTNLVDNNGPINVNLNSAVGGGAIFGTAGSTLSITNANFVDNAAPEGFGGAVCALNGVTLTTSDITGHDPKLEYEIRNAALGGAVFLGGGTMSMTNCNAANCTVSNNEGKTNTGHTGGVIFCWSRAADTVTISGGTFDGHKDGAFSTYQNARDGGMIYMRNGSLSISGATIKNFSAYNKGGAIYSWTSDVTVTNSWIYNCQAVGGDAPCGGAICNGSTTTGSNGGLLVLDHTVIAGNQAKNQGGAIYSKKSVTLKNGTIIGPAEIKGVSVGGNSTQGNAANAGGIYFPDSADCKLILGGENVSAETSRVTGNTASGGAVSNVRLPEITAEGADKGKNMQTCLEVRSTLGDDCLISVVNPNVLFWKFGDIAVDALADMACLKVGGTTPPDTNTARNIVGDDGKLYARIDPKDTTNKKIIWYANVVCRIVDSDGNVLYRDGNDTVYGTLFDAFQAYKTGTAANDFKVRTNPSESAIPARIEMLVDVYEMSKEITSNQISGYTAILTTAPPAADDTKNPAEYKYQGTQTRSRITRSSTFPSGNKMFFVGQNADITMKNIILGGADAEHKMTAAADGAVIRAEEGKVTLDTGLVIQYVDNSSSYCVDANKAKSTLVMKDNALIQYCSAANGGAVGVRNGANPFTMMGTATIDHCTATGSGGGIFSDSIAVTLQDEAKVTYCYATGNNSNGGGIYAWKTNASVTLKGSSQVGHCTATGSGGGILSQGTVDLQDEAKITYCEATKSGGGVYADVRFTMKNKTKIEHCTAGANGGGIGSKGTVTLQDSAKVTYCEGKDGGGIYAGTTNASVSISITDSSQVDNCTASFRGGGIRVENGSLEINGEGVQISNNKAVNEEKGQKVYGGAISSNSATVSLIQGEISGNQAWNKHSETIDNVEAYGGAISSGGGSGSVTISGGSISENRAQSQVNNAYGGAIVILDGSTVTISGGTITNNTAESVSEKIGSNTLGRDAMGGAVAVNKGTLVLKGGTITGNTAIGYRNTMGGGICVLDGNGVLKIEGSPVFGTKADGSDGNFVLNKKKGEDYSGKQNGGEAYPIPEGDKLPRSRQDIAIPALANDNARILITGNIGSAAGSIWVWAPDKNYKDNKDYPKDQQHFMFEQKFAKLDRAVSADTVTGLNAFRDAQDDKTSGNTQPGQYLIGVLKDGDTENVYWGYAITDTRKVVMRKVSKDLTNSLGGAQFRIFFAANLTEFTSGRPSGQEYYESADSGVYFVGEMPVGKYYIVETQAPDKANGSKDSHYAQNAGTVYQLTVESNQTTVVEKTPKAEGDTAEKMIADFKSKVRAGTLGQTG